MAKKAAEAYDVRVMLREVDPKEVLSRGTSVRRMWEVRRGTEFRYVYEDDRHEGLYSIDGREGWAVESVRQFLTR